MYTRSARYFTSAKFCSTMTAETCSCNFSNDADVFDDHRRLILGGLIDQRIWGRPREPARQEGSAAARRSAAGFDMQEVLQFRVKGHHFFQGPIHGFMAAEAATSIFSRDRQIAEDLLLLPTYLNPRG